MRKRNDLVIVDALHGFRGDHGVDDGLFGGLDGGEEDGIERVVRKHRELMQSLGAGRAGIGGGEGDKNISRTISGIAAIAAQPEGNSSGHAHLILLH